ncbi:hypothetical protein ABW21_db0204999 [Orbilia brochopaga]|nr:hypothetical protein ABW21_db0204999 [Drechslerella brochopaga]
MLVVGQEAVGTVGVGLHGLLLLVLLGHAPDQLRNSDLGGHGVSQPVAGVLTECSPLIAGVGAVPAGAAGGRLVERHAGRGIAGFVAARGVLLDPDGRVGVLELAEVVWVAREVRRLLRCAVATGVRVDSVSTHGGCSEWLLEL